MPIIHITQNDAGQTLEKFLKKLLPNAALALIHTLLRKKRVRVNDETVEKKYRLVPGDTVSIALSEEDFSRLSERTPKRLYQQRQLETDTIVYEDRGLLIINKNPGIAVHPGDHKSDEPSLIELVHDYLSDRLNSLTFRPALVHRLDRDTSGLIIIAKTKPVLDRMSKAFRESTVQKTYLAVTVGEPSQDSWIIDAPLLRHDTPTGPKMMIDPRGQSARTRYRIIRRDVRDRYTLVECTPETGRTHQIRAHLAHLGCPILGDSRYGDEQENSYARRHLGIVRHMLHAAVISFRHPIKDVLVTYRARLKEDMRMLVGEDLNTREFAKQSDHPRSGR